MRNNQRGFTLVEMLVALVVLTIGMLGVVGMQLQAMRYNTDAYLRTQATTLAYDIMDRMRANRGAAIAGLYAYTARPSGTIADCTAQCSSDEMARYDVAAWYDAIAARLPPSRNGLSSIAFDGTNYTINIRWNERELAVEHTWVVTI